MKPKVCNPINRRHYNRVLRHASRDALKLLPYPAELKGIKKAEYFEQLELRTRVAGNIPHWVPLVWSQAFKRYYCDKGFKPLTTFDLLQGSGKIIIDGKEIGSFSGGVKIKHEEPLSLLGDVDADIKALQIEDAKAIHKNIVYAQMVQT